MLKKILIGLVVLILIFVVVVAFQPSTYRVERSLAMTAPVPAVFEQVNNLAKATVWSPWLKLDPQAKVAYEGPAEGKGAVSTWSGNSQIGEGRQTIVESRANELVTLRLDFIKPFASTAMSDLTLKTADGKTVVTWSMYGDHTFISKAFCLFMNQDKMIGDPFEQGLAELKKIVETK